MKEPLYYVEYEYPGHSLATSMGPYLDPISLPEACNLVAAELRLTTQPTIKPHRKD